MDEELQKSRPYRTPGRIQKQSIGVLHLRSSAGYFNAKSRIPSTEFCGHLFSIKIARPSPVESSFHKDSKDLKKV